MSVESAADLAELLGDFGVTCNFGGDDFTAIPDYAFVNIQGVEDNYPIITCRTSDVSTLAHGDTGTVDGVSYTVVGIQPDGTGVTVIVLESA